MCRSIRKASDRHRGWTLLAFLAWLTLFSSGTRGEPLPLERAQEATSGLLLLAVRINGLDQGEVFRVLRLPDGWLAASDVDLQAWRLRPPVDAIQYGSLRYYRLDDIPRISYRLEGTTQTLLLEVPVSAFVDTILTPENRWMAGGLAPTTPGGFFNYDLQWQRYAGTASTRGLFEAAIFNSYGTGTTSSLWNSASPERQWVRLDSTWSVDDPDRMRSLRLGDTVSRAGSWGRAMRFGGVQWASNFATQPNFITFPLPSLRGEAALPSTVDVYLNNARILRSDVQPGPFDIPEVPVITGQGEVQLVVKDMLGRQQVITRPYYVSPQLLRPGLRDFSYELGAIREDYGMASAHYGRVMAIGTDRLGVTPEFTRELRVELLRDQQSLGAAGVWLWPRFGTFNLGGAVSRGEAGTGRMVSAGAERHTRSFTAALQVQHADQGFVQVGTLAGASPRRTITASLGVPLANSSLGLAYLSQSSWLGTESRLLSASFSMALGRVGYLGFYGLRNFSAQQGTTLGLTLIHVLDPLTSVSGDTNLIGGQSQTNLQLQRSLPTGNGFGYRLLAGQGQYDRYDASAVWRTSQGDLSVEGGRFFTSDYYRAGVSGGIAVLGGSAFVSRRIEESFAVIKVGDFAGVRVYRDNQEIGRTNAEGMILATRLLPYHQNRISVEQADLPMDAWVDKLQLKLTPALRAGVYAEMPVRRLRNAVFRLVDEDGAVLPPGSLVRLEGQTLEFPVGYEGRTFISGIDDHSRLRAVSQGRHCVAELRAGQGSEPVMDLGTVVCKGGVE